MKFSSILFLVVMFWCGASNATPLPRGNLIANGNFESGDLSSWVVSEAFGQTTGPFGVSGDQFPSPLDGNFSAFFDGFASLQQTVNISPKHQYIVSFEFLVEGNLGGSNGNGGHVTTGPPGCLGDTSGTCNDFAVFFDGASIPIFESLNSSCAPCIVQIPVQTLDDTALLDFELFNAFFLIDDVSITACHGKQCGKGGPSTFSALASEAIPEPGTIFFILPGLLLLARRRSRNALSSP